ncbi:ankyrin repeat domain-containing protein 53-like [Ruditapes philippinarum]|uniref:ankyrin repeat domain-containing protein 53-like n=1 Tax=Ruditapes philippinarum TaxID=129788 RepID=UPI00295BD162|nr:ankyrin repeat domain-containing protein 53-like [Ruditapes philippinarum]
MSLETQTQTGASGSARPYRRRRTRVGNDKKIQDDEFMAAAIGDVEWLRQSLRDQKLEHGQINYDKNGLTALHLSAIHGRLECLKLLIEKYKFDINLPSSTGWRAIHLCISNQTGKRAIQCLQYLLDKKADSSVGNDDGITPLHQAASEGHVQCLKMLIDHGAKIDGEDCRGHTPLDLAKLWGHRKCARIIAAEMWQQGKDNIAKEMQQLRKLKMQQVLREMELEAEYKAQNEHYSEEAFKKWLSKQGLEQDKPTGPKHVKERKESDKQESLMKANSVSTKSSTTVKSKGNYRRPDSIPTWKTPRPREMSPLSRKTTNISQVTEEEDTGLYEIAENNDQVQTEKRAKSAGFVNPTPWKIPLKASDPPYITNLTDDYPRDDFTKMPLVESAPKYFDGRAGPRLYKKDVKEGSIDTKKKLRKPNVPKEIAKRIMTDDPTLDERPVLFKPKHIADVQVKKKYGDEVVGKSEVSLHLCDDMSSFLFKNSLNKGADFNVASKGKPLTAEHRKLLENNSILDSHPSTRSTSTSNWSSIKFPRERVLQSLHIMSKPGAFPDMKGEEYIIGSGQMTV